MAAKSAVARLTADTKGFDRGLKAASKKWLAFGKGLGKGLGQGLPKGLKGAGGKLAGGLKGVAGIGGRGIGGMLGGLKTAVGLGGLGGLAVLAGNEANKTLKFESALVRLRIASMGTIKQLGPLRKQIFDISDATGVAREEVLGGARAYVRLTGDAKTALSSMELFAKVSKGQDTPIEDVAAAAARLRQNMKIVPEQFEKAFSIVARSGKVGSVELNEMAGLLAGLAPRMEQFKGGSGLGGLAELSGAFQLSAQGFKDSSEAATGIESLMGAVVQHADKLKALGVRVFDRDLKTGKDHLRGFQEIVESIGKSKAWKLGRLTKIQDALGRKEALQTLRMLLKTPGAWNDIAAATMRANDVQEDYIEYSNSTAGRLEKSLEHLQNAIAQTFTPDRIDAFARAIEAAIQMVKDLAEWIEDGPFDWLLGKDRAGGLEDKETEYAERFEKMGKTPEEVEAMVEAGAMGEYGTVVAKEMRRRRKEREDRDNTRRQEEGEVFSAQDTTDAPTESERWQAEDERPSTTTVTQRPIGGVDYSGMPATPGRDPWRQQVSVSITASPEFQATIDNAPQRRLRP